MRSISGYSLLRAALVVLLALQLSLTVSFAHSGKPRWHVIVDTDAAIDDLRTICMLLGSDEVEVLAITASEGAMTPHQAAMRVTALLGDFHHEGIPVGIGRGASAPVPAWRENCSKVDWGKTTASNADLPSASELIVRTIDNEPQRVTVVALGALTSLHDVLMLRPDAGNRIERIVWYNGGVDTLACGTNFEIDPLAARTVLNSGIPVDVVSADRSYTLAITRQLLDSIASIPTAYACKIVETHRAAPLRDLVQCSHLHAWDDLTAVFLLAPHLFTCRRVNPTVVVHTLTDDNEAESAVTCMLSILRGRPDAENRVFGAFPLAPESYAPDVARIIDSAIMRHGHREWRAGVLTNELHGHLGIYATIGVKMGIRVREYFNIGVDDIRVVSYAGSHPPVSCFNDGVQVATGATLGHGLITLARDVSPRPEACFDFNGRTVRLALRDEYARRIADDVRRGVELHGNLTPAYWQYVRELALQYWLEFDRHEMFDIGPITTTSGRGD